MLCCLSVAFVINWSLFLCCLAAFAVLVFAVSVFAVLVFAVVTNKTTEKHTKNVTLSLRTAEGTINAT